MTLCGQWVSDGRMGYPCNREAVEDGMCKPHLAGRKRSAKVNAKRAEEAEAKRAVEDATAVKAARLAELGIVAGLEYSGITYSYTGRVTVDPDELIALLEDAKS